MKLNVKPPPSLGCPAPWLLASFIAISLGLLPSKQARGADDKAKLSPATNTAKPDGFDPGPSISLLEAVRLTLSRSQNIQIQQTQAEVSRGTLVTQEGAFDTHVTANGTKSANREPVVPAPVKTPATAPITFPLYNLTTGQPESGFGVILPGQAAAPVGPTVFNQGLTTVDVGLNKLLGNGVLLQADSIYNRENQVPNGPALDLSELRLTVQVPVLRAFTKSDQAYEVTSDKYAYEASLLTYRHVVTEAIYQTAQAYWALRSAQEQLDLLRAYEEAAISLRKLITVLISGDERGKSEIHQADAYVFEATGRRLAGEQAVFEARQALGVAIGLDRTGLHVAPTAGEPFPPANGLEHIAKNQDRLVDNALLLRADYQAYVKAQLSAQALLAAARLDLLPQFNFQLKTSEFGGAVGDSFHGFEHSVFGRQTGVSVAGQFQFDFPIENRAAQGNVVSSSARVTQARVQTSQLETSIVSGVLVSIEGLMSGARQLMASDEAVAAYRGAVETERLKFQAGTSTLLDVIETEDRLINEMLTEVSAKQQIAVAYAQLRFQSGTMLLGQGKTVTITPNALETVPPLAEEAPTGPSVSFRIDTQIR